MERGVHLGLWVALILTASSAAGASDVPDGTPEHAIVEILTASKPEAVEKHLPESVRSALRTLSESDRRACGDKLLVGRELQAGGKLQVPADGHALLVLQPDEEAEPSELRVERELIGGSDALLKLIITGETQNNGEVLVWMRFEDGDWRITELQWLRSGNQLVLDDPGFVEQFRRPEQKAAEASAVQTLRQLRWALRRYAITYPEAGLPADLAVLGSPEESVGESLDGVEGFFEAEDPPNADHAGLLTNTMATNQFVQDGYYFRYQLRVGGSDGAYSIIARPTQYGETATRSFYTDETGEVRGTNENREATVRDEPIE